MARTSSARTTAPAPRRALDRLLSADEVAEFLGIPVATWGRAGVSVATRTAATHDGAESGILVSLVAELTGPVRPGLLPS
jgi:hypothetical protein